MQENPNQENTSFYRRADNLAELTQESRVYWIDEVDNEYIELEFGDGFFGKKLADNAKIFVTYVVTNGPLANGIHGNSNFVFIGSAFDIRWKYFQFQQSHHKNPQQQVVLM